MKIKEPLISCDTVVALPNSTSNNTTIFGKNSDRPKLECQPLVQKPRTNFTNSVGLSIIVIFLYYLLIKFGQTLGYNDIINPFISVWMVNLIFLLFGTHLFIKSRT